jgi:uncharacterized protein YkwD
LKARPWAWLLATVLSCEAPHDDAQGSSSAGLPSRVFCDPSRSWPSNSAELELALVDRINEHRARGAQCSGIARFPPSPPLQPGGAATCAARLHALDMATNDFVRHRGSDESSPWDRLRSAGSSFAVADQVIAAGELSPEIVDELWMSRPGSCATLMAPEYERLGIGWSSADDRSTHRDYVVGMVERSRAVTTQ